MLNDLSDSVHNDFSTFRSRGCVWLDATCVSQEWMYKWASSVECGTGSPNKKVSVEANRPRRMRCSANLGKYP